MTKNNASRLVLPLGLTHRKWLLPFLVGAATRLFLAFFSHGFRQMDEHWQVYEPAHFLIHDVWSRTVEWEQGLRCWIFPWLISGPMRFAELIGVKEPIWIAAFVRATLGMLSLLAIPLGYWSARAWTTRVASRPDSSTANPFALACAWLIALWPYAAYCGTRAHNEMTAALFVLAGTVAPTLLARRDNLAYLASGAAFGAAFALKIDVAVAGLGYGVWQLLNLRFKRAVMLAAGALPFVGAIGLADKLAWGEWFGSVLGHWHANMVEQVGNQWGVSPWYTHVFYYANIVGVAALALFALPWVWRRLPESLRAAWFMNAFFVGVFCVVPHKEKRFIAPLIYTGLLTGVATAAYVWPYFSTAKRRRLAKAIIVAALAVHFAADAYVYGFKRPWWNRLSAIRAAGRAPGIQAMLSPQWPAQFYLPRHVHSQIVGGDENSLRQATLRLDRFSVAADWTHLRAIEKWGFSCTPWPSPRPFPERELPWAWLCTRSK